MQNSEKYTESIVSKISFGGSGMKFIYCEISDYKISRFIH